MDLSNDEKILVKFYKTENFSRSLLSLTAVNLIRGAVVSAVIESVTHKRSTDAASVSTGKLCDGVTGGKGTADLIAVISTVICVVAHVVHGHTATIITGKISG